MYVVCALTKIIYQLLTYVPYAQLHKYSAHPIINVSNDLIIEVETSHEVLLKYVCNSSGKNPDRCNATCIQITYLYYITTSYYIHF